MEYQDHHPAEPHNLPHPATPFVGRDNDLAETCALLTGANCRLLTLVGPGGIGKTRLAFQAATLMSSHFGDGVWLVEVADLRDSALVPQAMALALGLCDLGAQPATQALAAHLGFRHLLLVLDNCEHLLEACAQEAHALLAACPNLRILATSTQPLHVAGEVVWQVDPLSLPDPEQIPTPAGLARSEAVQLFVDRATRVLPSFSITRQNATAVARICRRLEGLPLALELAAARVKVLSTAQIADHLENSLRLLSNKSTTTPQRHHSMQAVLDWSHDLLSLQEQILFRRLAVFAGTFDLAATEAVCADHRLGRATILDLVNGLADRSLLRVTRTTGSKRRYRLLEPVRHYSREKLRSAREEAEVEACHLDWYLTLAEGAQPVVWGAAGTDSVRWLEAEQDNMRAALQWSYENGRIEENQRLAAALGWFWYVRANLREGLHWLDQALAASEGTSSLARAQVLDVAGALAVHRFDDHERAMAYVQEGIDLAREQECVSLVAWGLLSLGRLRLFGGNYAQAGERLEESWSLFRTLGDDIGMASALLYKGVTACHRHDYGRATVLLEECLPVLREVGDNLAVARALHGLGVAARHRQDLRAARAQIEEMLMLARDQGARLAIAQSLEALAGIICAQGLARRATRLFAAADSLFQSIGTSLPIGLKPEHDQDIEAARAELGKSVFSAAWSAGQDMTPEAAIAFALDTPAPSAPSRTPLQIEKQRYGGLTRREREVASLVAQGRSNAQIAAELVVTVRTVEAHMTHILGKLGFASRTQVAAWGIAKDLAPPPKTLEEKMRAD